MFQGIQRLRATIDNRIAEEQARQKAISTLASSPSSRSGSARRARQASSPSRGPGTSTDRGRTADAQVDPSQFDSPVRHSEDVPSEDRPKPDDSILANGESSKALPSGKLSDVTDATVSAPLLEDPHELPADVRIKLRRLDRIEGKYKDLLAQYRIAYARASLIEPFEQSLKEVTPFVSVGDPAGLVGFINQLNTKAELALDEFKKVSADRNDQAKRVRELELQLESQNKPDQVPASGEAPAPVPTLQLPPKSAPLPSRPSTTLSRQASDAKIENLSPTIKSASIFSRSLFGGSKKGEEPEQRREPDELFDFDQAAEEDRHLGEDAQLQSMQEQIAQLQGELETKRAAAESLNDDLQKAVNDLKRSNEVQRATEQELTDARASATFDTEASKQEIGTLTTKITKIVEQYKLERSELDQRIEGLQKQLEESNARAVDVHQSRPSTAEGAPSNLQPAEASAVATANKKRRKNKKKQGTQVEQARPAAEDGSEQALATPALDKQIDVTQQEEVERQQEVKRREADGKVEELEKQHRADLEALRASREQNEELTNALLALRDEVGGTSAKLAEIKAALATAESALSSSRADGSSLQVRLDNSDKALGDLRSQHTALQSTHDSALLDASAIRTTLESKLESSTSALASERKAREQLESSLSHRSQELATMQRERRAGQDLIDQMNSAIDSAHQQRDTFRSEVQSLKSQQKGAERSAAGFRDANTELNTRLIEAIRKAEGLEEEVVELQTLLRERSREAEVLRRMMEDGKQRQGQEREIQDKLEKLEEEHERAAEEKEIEVARLGKAAKELQGKLELQARELGALQNERHQLQDQVEARQGRIETLESDMADSKKALDSLRAVLDQMGEQNARSLDKVRKEWETRLEAKEAKIQGLLAAQAKQQQQQQSLLVSRTSPDRISERPAPSASNYRRPSAQRIGSPSQSPAPPLARPPVIADTSAGRPLPTSVSRQVSNSSAATMPKVPVDLVYLRNVLLQFLEQREKRTQVQLLPVISTLLELDQKEEGRWKTVLSSGK